MGLKPLKLKNVPSKYLSALYNPEIIPTKTQNDVLRPNNPRNFPVLHKLAHTPRDRLAWSVNTNTLRSKVLLASVRNHVRRKCQEAFRNALRERGYDNSGRQLIAQPGNPIAGSLRGTMDILLWGDVNPYESKDVLEGFAREILTALEKANGIENKTKVG